MYTNNDLLEAHKSILSTLKKCEKVILHFEESSYQYKNMMEFICAYRISLDFINAKIENNENKKYAIQECKETISTLEKALKKVIDIYPKLKENSSQQTLTKRRIAAFTLAIQLIEER